MRSVFVTVPVFSDQAVELGERGARVMRVGVRHRRIFAHDVHAANLALMHGIHDFHHGETRLRIERHAP